MQNSFKTLIAPSKSILILLPENPTFDEVAGATSLYEVLKETKEVNIYCPTPMTVEFNNLVGVNKIKNELGNKNLAITFHDYNPQGIETVSWDIDDGKFKLTVVPKVNAAPPNQDQVIISYSGVAANLAILIGGKDENSFPAIKGEDLKDVNLAHIGTQELRVTARTLASLASAVSSVSENVFGIIKDAGFKIDNDIATNLLMGIENASNSFTSQTMSADTFDTIAQLMRAGGRRIKEALTENRSFTTNQIPTNVPSSWTEPKIFKGTSVS